MLCMILGFGSGSLLTHGILKLLPVYVALVAAPAQPVVPSTLGMLEDHFEHLEVATYTIVLVIATQFQHLTSDTALGVAHGGFHDTMSISLS